MSDSHLLNEIARLAAPSHRPPPYPARGGFSNRGRGRGRGFRGGYGGIRKASHSSTRQWTREGAPKEGVTLVDETNSNSDHVCIQGMQYKTSPDRSKLIRLDDSARNSPKKAVVGGVPYIRSKSGKNMIRSDKACPYFTRTGTCGRGKSCPFRHHPDHVVLCKHFLMGNCNRPDCSLSHKPTPYNSPLCLYYANGNCSNVNCKFTHKDNVYSGTPVCEEFALNGYCDDGLDCEFRHVFECPEFDRTGHCTRPKCKLKHVLRAKKEEKPKEQENQKVDLESLTNALYENSDEENENADENENEKSKSDNEDDSEEESEPESDANSSSSNDHDYGNDTLDQDFIRIN